MQENNVKGAKLFGLPINTVTLDLFPLYEVLNQLKKKINDQKFTLLYTYIYKLRHEYICLAFYSFYFIIVIVIVIVNNNFNMFNIIYFLFYWIVLVFV